MVRVYIDADAAAVAADDDDDDDDAVKVVGSKRARMRMYADDVTPHQHPTTRYVHRCTTCITTAVYLLRPV